MRAVEIDRGDARRIGDEIGQDIAAAGRDRDHMAVRRDRECLKIDFRIFPDLRIDEPLEQAQGEEMLEQARARHQRTAPDSVIQPPAGGCHRTGGQCNLLQ